MDRVRVRVGRIFVGQLVIVFFGDKEAVGVKCGYGR